MKKLIIFITIFLISCQNIEEKQVAKLDSTSQKLEKIYTINADQKQQGYAYKYSWYNNKNKERSHYFVHDLRGNLIGYIGDRKSNV